MLVLARKPGEKIVIGKAGDTLTEPIEVMMVETRTNGAARFGVTAQIDVNIRRSELPPVEQGSKQ